MSAAKLQVIENEAWQLGVLPETGGSIAFGRIRQGDQWVDFMRPTPEAAHDKASDCSSYVLVPWSNRIRDARFRFQGKTYQLKANHGDGTAIHGIARNYPWHIDSVTATSVTLRYRSIEWPGVDYPFPFSTKQTFRLDGKTLLLSTSVKNEGDKPMPAGFGHHPYFQRALTGPADTISLEIPCTQYFELENCLPKEAPKPIIQKLDFRQLRPLGTDFIDDCLAGRIDTKPARFVYGQSGKEIRLHSDSLFTTMILYAPVGKTFFALEPVTNANDGFNLYDNGISGNGVFVLEPGEERSGEIGFEII